MPITWQCLMLDLTTHSSRLLACAFCASERDSNILPAGLKVSVLQLHKQNGVCVPVKADKHMCRPAARLDDKHRTKATRLTCLAGSACSESRCVKDVLVCHCCCLMHALTIGEVQDAATSCCKISQTMAQNALRRWLASCRRGNHVVAVTSTAACMVPTKSAVLLRAWIAASN